MEIIREEKHWGTGNAEHNVYILDYASEQYWEKPGKFVMLVNEDDDYYSWVFRDKETLQDLIDTLNRAKEEVFGK